MLEATPPAPETILADPGASYWLKGALNAALVRDPVDAARDASLLAEILSHRAQALLGTPANSG